MRVYAEAETREGVEALARDVARAVYAHAGDGGEARAWARTSTERGGGGGAVTMMNPKRRIRCAGVKPKIAGHEWAENLLVRDTPTVRSFVRSPGHGRLERRKVPRSAATSPGQEPDGRAAGRPTRNAFGAPPSGPLAVSRASSVPPSANSRAAFPTAVRRSAPLLRRVFARDVASSRAGDVGEYRTIPNVRGRPRRTRARRRVQRGWCVPAVRRTNRGGHAGRSTSRAFCETADDERAPRVHIRVPPASVRRPRRIARAAPCSPRWRSSCAAHPLPPFRLFWRVFGSPTRGDDGSHPAR